VARNDKGKYATPKWVDRALISIMIAIPILYVLGFSVNYGPSMSHLGWFYRTDWGKQPTRVGQIVRFSPPDQPVWRKYILPSTKRVVKILPNGKGYVVYGDNNEMSKDSRDWGKPILPSSVGGIITWAWNPLRKNTGMVDASLHFNYGIVVKYQNPAKPKVFAFKTSWGELYVFDGRKVKQIVSGDDSVMLKDPSGDFTTKTITWSKDGDSLICVSTYNHLLVWSYVNGNVRDIGIGDRICLSPDNRKIATISSGHAIVINLINPKCSIIAPAGQIKWHGNYQLIVANETGEPGNWAWKTIVLPLKR